MFGFQYKYIFKFIYSEVLTDAIQNTQIYVTAVSVYDRFPKWLYVKSFGGFLTLCVLPLTISFEESVMSRVLLSTISVSGSESTLLSIVLSLMFFLRMNTNSLSDSESELTDVDGSCCRL